MLKPNDWDVVAANPEFRALLQAKKRFIVPATIAFIAYYFALPILVGYAPAFMATPVIGPVNIAYLFALSQFFVAWLIAFLYVRAAESLRCTGTKRAGASGAASRRKGQR